MIIPSPAPSLSKGANCLHQLEFHALGTQCSIKFRLSDDREAVEFSREVLVWIKAFEAKFSRFRPDSIISRVNASAGLDWTRVDAEMDRMLDIADDFYQRTGGILDPTMLPLLRIWDWRSIRLSLPLASEINTALALTGWQMVERRPGAVRLPKLGMGLDFGYFGRQHAVDHLARLANRRGISNALIDLGRDLFALGGSGTRPFWHVGIEDGVKPGQCRGGLAVSDLAASTSGDFTRFFIHNGVRYGHILDPRTGWPVANGMRAVTVIARSCLQAGMYSTAAHILGPSEGIQFASHIRGLEISAQSETGIEDSRNFGRFLVQSAGNAPQAIGQHRIARQLTWLER